MVFLTEQILYKFVGVLQIRAVIAYRHRPGDFGLDAAVHVPDRHHDHIVKGVDDFWPSIKTVHRWERADPQCLAVTNVSSTVYTHVISAEFKALQILKYLCALLELWERKVCFLPIVIHIGYPRIIRKIIESKFCTEHLSRLVGIGLYGFYLIQQTAESITVLHRETGLVQRSLGGIQHWKVVLQRND